MLTEEQMTDKNRTQRTQSTGKDVTECRMYAASESW
jgi:hypothetical protein